MRVNSHTHIFNLGSVTTKSTLEIIENRVIAAVVERNFVHPKVSRALGKYIARKLVELLEDAPALDQSTLVREETLVREILEELEESTGLVGELRDAIPSLPGKLGDLVGERLDGLALLGLRSVVSRLTGRLRREGNLRKTTLGDLIDFLVIALQGELGSVATRLLEQLDPDDAAVALMMDMGVKGTIANRLEDQKRYLSHLEATHQAMLDNPGRILPFVGVHPGRKGSPSSTELRDYVDLMKDAIETRGFVGVKLYPALGYSPDSEELDPIYAYCAEHSVPIMTHTSGSGFYASEDTRKFSNPALFGAVLTRHPGLKVCLAHFGGSSGVKTIRIPKSQRVDPSWQEIILNLMDEHAGAFTDISFHTAPMKEGGVDEELYFEKLKALLAHPDYRGRILFGTDYWLVRTQLTEAHHWRYFEENLTAAEFARIADTNPRAYLGLPDAAGRGASEPVARQIQSYIGAIGKIKARPAEWLLSAVKAQDEASFAVLDALRTAQLPSTRLRIQAWDDAIDRLIDEPLTASFAAGRKLVGDGDGWKLAGSRFRLAGVDLGVTANARLAVEVLNEPAAAAADSVLSNTLGVQASAFDTRAWLKYRLEGALALKGSATFDPSVLGLGFEAGKSVILSDYRMHHRSGASTREVVKSDLRRPRFALSRADVMRLETDDALSLRVTGTFGGKVTLAWSGVFAGNLNALGKALGVTGPLDIEIGVGAAVTGGLSVTDDFRVVFARPRGNSAERPYRVSVRKAKSRGKTFGIEVGATARFSEPEVVERVLSAALGDKLAKVERLVESSGQLTKSQNELRDRVVGRLGLDSKALPAIKKKLEELKEKAAQGIEKIAHAELKAGFAFEYGKVVENGVLMEANLSEEAMAELHSDLVRGDLAVLLERAPHEPDEMELVEFLHEKITTRSRSWGFSFGLLSRFASFKDFDYERTHEQMSGNCEKLTNPSCERKVTFLGRRGYEVKSKKKDVWSGWKWSGELVATMDEFEHQPTVRDLRYALELRFEWRQKLGKDLTEGIADAAHLWQAVGDPQDAITALQPFANKLPTVQLQLRVHHDELVRLLRVAAPLEDDLVALSLGAAMPYRNTKKDPVRKSVLLRRRMYAGLWKRYLADSRARRVVRPQTYGQLVRSHFRDLADGDKRIKRAGAIEDQEAVQKFGWTFPGAVSRHPELFENLVSAHEGLQAIWEAVRPQGAQTVEGAPIESVHDIYADLKPYWSQCLQIRAFGRYLFEAAALIQGGRSLVESSLTIEHQDTVRILGVPQDAPAAEGVVEVG